MCSQESAVKIRNEQMAMVEFYLPIACPAAMTILFLSSEISLQPS
jgi:hypothetical protein